MPTERSATENEEEGGAEAADESPVRWMVGATR